MMSNKEEQTIDQINILTCLKYHQCYRERGTKLKMHGSNVINFLMTNHWSYTTAQRHKED